MAAKLIVFQAIDYSGTPLSGAKLYVYQAGTTTPISLYQTPSLLGGASATNPVIATSSGMAAAWFDDAVGDVKIIARNSADTITYFGQDNMAPVDRVIYPLGGSDQETNTDSSVQFAALTLTGTMTVNGVTIDPSGATLGQALGFPNSTTTLEPYTPAGGGDTLAAANETITGLWTYSYAEGANGRMLEIVKTDSPLNYRADTRAAFVVQSKDELDLGQTQIVPQVVFDMTVDADGYVVPGAIGAGLSDSIWMGVLAVQRKYGDGSAHCFTGIGELHPVGATGYNEMGLFQASATNQGSVNGNLSGAELLLSDSNNQQASGTNWATLMTPFVSRIAQFNSGSVTRNFFASSEGSVPVGAVMTLNDKNPTSPKWVCGVDFSVIDAPFTTGHAFRTANNTYMAWKDVAGSLKPILGVNNTDITYVLSPTAAGKGVLGDLSFGSKLEWSNDATDAISIYVGGSLKKITEGAADSGGTGFKVLRVPN